MSKYVYHVVYQNAGLRGCSPLLRNMPIDSVEAMDNVLRSLKNELGLALEEPLVITNFILLRGPEVPAAQRQFNEMCQVWGPVEEYARKHPKLQLGDSISTFIVDRMKELDRIEGEAAKAKMPDLAVNWVVNNRGELGVEVRGRYFFLYKGESLEYDTGELLLDGNPLKVRPVGKREFGEVCRPLTFLKVVNGVITDMTPYPFTQELDYTPGLSFGKPEDQGWKPINPEVNGE